MGAGLQRGQRTHAVCVCSQSTDPVALCRVDVHSRGCGCVMRWGIAPFVVDVKQER